MNRSSLHELFPVIERDLYTAVLSDALDDLGFRQQAMRETLRPVTVRHAFCGIARTIWCMDQFHIPPEPYAKELEALDSIEPGEVVVVATGESKRNAPWGELLSTAAKVRGARGAVVDGLVRDIKKIDELGFALFAAGIKPLDSKDRGAVVAYGIPIDCGGVLVSPGDLIVADFDGIIAVPAAIAKDAVLLAAEKAGRENQTREELMKGAYLRDVYAKYGVL
jgi:4-hydroxy-4-methyl-2-oxoglutarate aldolase